MPPQPYTTLHAFTAPAPKMEDYAIFGGIVPFPQSGLPWLMAALVLFLLTGIIYKRLSQKALKVLLGVGVLLTYTATFILSSRWLDDVFINLIHPYNLFHHGLFSTRMDSMTNGTVEIFYYALLTPFAATRAGLVRADYVAGALLGIGHLVAIYYLLRRMPVFARFLVLTLFAAWIPIMQLFSSGYGNGVVTLLWLFGVIAVLDDKQRNLAIFAALMPLFRPEALVYSFSLAAMYVIVHRRFQFRWWIPTLLAPVLYALVVHQMYHQWVPTPIVFKRVTTAEIVAAVPGAMAKLLTQYLLGSIWRSLLLALAALYLLLPIRWQCCLNRRILAGMLLSTLPILLFFYTTGQYGYNPTNYRYYAIFDFALFFAGTMGLLSLLNRLAEYVRGKNKSVRGYLLKGAVFLPAAFVALVQSGISSSIELVQGGNWLGTDIGISCTFYDLKRMNELRFGGEYFGKVVPAGWEIGSTEMDTFGYFSGREILDLWGFSNMRIAKSEDKTIFFRRDTHLLMDSNVPVFWVRTLSKYSSADTLWDDLASNQLRAFEFGLYNFPNLTDSFGQAGHLDTTLRKYDVVRVVHGGSEISLLLVRKDLAKQFCDSLVRNGATPIGTVPLPLAKPQQ